jgi:pimeloyl-ACP methyl ester carboxylesterase
MRTRKRRDASILAALALLCLLPGCALLERVLGVKEQFAEVRQAARVEGEIDTDGEAHGALVVLLTKLSEAPGAAPVPADTFVRVRPGSFAFPVEPGAYRLGAYEDRNGNGRLDRGERLRLPSDGPVHRVGPGEVAREEIVLASGAEPPRELGDSIDVFALVARTPHEQLGFSLWAWSVQGEVCEDLGDPRFGRESGTQGLWEVLDFLNAGIAGVYFLEPYDPRRIPVLFVHGLGGSPQELRGLMEGLDRTRFQPWFYFYPSGFPLDGISSHLATLLTRLELKHGVEELAIVAHSMGGLVSRGAILKHWQETRRDSVRLLVTLATPWGGDVRAERAEGAPIELPPSFADMDPKSDYLRWLFQGDDAANPPLRLPSSVEFHMLMSFHMPGRSGTASDGTVTLASQARLEAQEQAASVRAYDYGHVAILASPEARERLNALLAQRFR